jgi:pimeloyl-ACP methyl ester carboxylesterase
MWRRSISVGEGRPIALSVTEWSRRGPPCVFIHGLGDAACIWDRLAKRLMPSFRVAAVDLRGHGDSAWDPETRYDTETLTGDLSVIVEALGFEQVVLVGHSLGAAVAIRFAADNASLIAGLVVVDFGPELYEKGVDEIVRNFAVVPRRFNSPEAYAEWLTARRPLADPSVILEFARCSLRSCPSGDWEVKADAALVSTSQISMLEHSNGRYHYPELWHSLEQIKCPSLVVRGMASGVFPGDVATRMAERALSAGRLATIGAAGHAVMMDNPSEFGNSVVSFLGNLAST